jgi:hypothetical protein
VGDVTVVACGVLAVLGLALVCFGAVRRSRTLVVAGVALLLGLAGAWTLGLYGAVLGLVAFALLRRGRAKASVGAALALTLIPCAMFGQTTSSAREEVVWHWFGSCAGSDSLFLEVRLDGASVYSATFPICHERRRDIKPEPQQRLLTFRFVGVPHRFRPQSRKTEIQAIDGAVWEAGDQQTAIQLGVAFAAGDEALLNMHHVASASFPSRSERVRGLVITTRPVRSDHAPPK